MNSKNLTGRIAITATPSRPRYAPLLVCGDLPGAFFQAAALECEGVEIHIRRAEDLDVQMVKRLKRELGLAVPTLGTGMAAAEGLSLCDPRGEIRDRTVERVRGHIECAAELGSAVTIGILNGNLGHCRSEQRQSRRSRAVECLARLCDVARPLAVTLLLEPVNRYECDYINTLADGARVVGEIGAPNLKLLADTFHMNIEEPDLAVSLKLVGTLIRHVHLADTNRQAPGHGHLDLEGILGALSDIEYQGGLAFEVLPLPDPDTAIRDGISAVRSALICAPQERNTFPGPSRKLGRPERRGPI